MTGGLGATFTAPGALRAADTGNRVLSGLAEADAARLLPRLEPLNLAQGEVLGHTGEGPSWALFPRGAAVVSVIAECDDGRTAEAHAVGSEGMLGPTLVTLPKLGYLRVQMPGQAWRLDAAALAGATAESARLRDWLAAHDHAMLARLVQSAVCAALHPVEARVSRWLLTALERVGQPELPLTQEMLADLLGVRRTTVTRIMAQLTDKGVIQRRRSRVIVTDPSGLEAAACGCHAALRERLRSLAPTLHAH